MHPSVLLALTFAPAVLLLALFAVLKRRRRLVHGAEPEMMVRTASLNASTVNESGWWFGLLSTLLLLAGTATLLALRWQTIPERFPVHWGLDGQPNGWTNRSFGSIFGPLLFTFALVGGLGLLGEFDCPLLPWTRRPPRHDQNNPDYPYRVFLVCRYPALLD